MTTLTESNATTWTCIWNVFTPFWSISKAGSEAGPGGRSALEVYVPRPDMRQWRGLSLVMEPSRTVERAIVVGQRGAGKSMDLAWQAYELSKTYMIFWVDAVEQTAEVLYNPIGFFVAVASAIYEGARQTGCEPDKQLFEAFLSTCLDTTTTEKVSGKKFTLHVDKVLKSLVGSVSQVLLPKTLEIGNPIFMAAGGVATLAMTFLNWMDSGVEEQGAKKQIRKESPSVDRAAACLTTFVHDIARRCGRPILVIVDGLDRVEVPQLRDLFQRGRDLARPDLRLILTAPLVLYATPEFGQLQNFFPHVAVSSNITVRDSTSEGQQFLHRVVQRRLALCEKEKEQVFENGALEQLFAASGGNLRQLITLIRQASLEAQLDGKVKIDQTAAEAAMNDARNELANRMRQDERQALQDFFRQSDPRIPPSGALGDGLLRSKYILAYQERDTLRYTLNPLIEAYLHEEGLL